MGITTRHGGFFVSRIHQLQGRLFSKMLKDQGISEINPAQGRILFVLWQEDGIQLNLLAKRTALGVSTLTRMIDRLEEQKQVLRVADKVDRRKARVFLTRENRKMRAAYDAVSDRMSELFYHGFSEADIQKTERFLSRILENLAHKENAKDGPLPK